MDMLNPELETRRRRAAIAQDRQEGRLTDREAGIRMIETDPDFGGGYALLAMDRMDQDDWDGAEEFYWQALDRMPCDFKPYLMLADLRQRRDAQDPMAKRLLALGVWKVGWMDDVRRGAQEIFRMRTPEAKLDFADPATYQMLATAMDREFKGEPPARLMPYEWLNDIEGEAATGLDPEFLEQLIAHAPEMLPLWRAAARNWAEGNDVPASEALGLMIALVGETGAAADAARLLPLMDLADDTVRLHACWAIWRLGQRMPAEVLAEFQGAAGASLGVRCGIAEHLGLLPETPGREALALRLLDGFAEFAREEDASYLLATVLYTVEHLGRPTDAERVYREYHKLLSKKDREWLLDVLDDGFVPRLRHEEIEGLTIGEICSESILMDDGEEDEEEFEEDEFEDELEEQLPVVAPPKPGRNDPCWCGSGKKYKKCHLAADEEAERSGGDAKPAAEQSVHGRLYDKLLEATRQFFGRGGFAEATLLYFDQRPEDLDAEAEDDKMTGFFNWYLHDFRPKSTGRTAVEEYLRRRPGALSAAERELLESWRGARFGIWEVERVEPGEGVEVKDWFEGDTFFVHDVSSSRDLVRWDCLLTRVYRERGEWYFAGSGSSVPRNLMDRLAERVERESREAGQSAGEYVRANSHLWHRAVDDLYRRQIDGMRIVNAEGDTLEFGAALYRVEDEAAVTAALEQAKPFEPQESEEPGVHTYAWLEHVEGPRRSYGRIEMKDGKLRLEVNSRKRLQIGRQLVEKFAGEWLRHERDTFETLDDVRRAAAGKKPQQPAKALPADVEREVVQKLRAEHYARWVDEPVPALDGQTPREAVRSETGRKAVEDLLRLFENAEERARREGRAAFDFSGIRRELGL
jgi:hypothetical protein